MVYGITRIRNESLIIRDTLNHWSSICNGGIFVYDDKSTDDTVNICKSHHAVKEVICGRTWDTNRLRAEFQNRQAVLSAALKHTRPNDWIVYFDADEFLYKFDPSILRSNIDGVICRLFDVYITDTNKHLSWKDRDAVGPEYRDILFFFKVSSVIGYHCLDQRECTLKSGSSLVRNGYIKHYGKGFSVEQWEETCRYYSKYFPVYADKWEARKGKAIHHTKSDFGSNLISFSDVLKGSEKGFLLKH
jgi:glycosyltransferase involved in cell wall biosynthesis